MKAKEEAKGAGLVLHHPSMAWKRPYPDHVPELKASSKSKRSFIVADTETVIINDVHKPYAAGFLVVNPDLSSNEIIETYFSEDHRFFIPEFEERSNRMFFDFRHRLEVLALERSYG